VSRIAKYVSPTLRNDCDFVGLVVQATHNHHRILHYAGPNVKYNEEIFIMAIAKNGGTIPDCFDVINLVSRGDININTNNDKDYAFLCQTATHVRSTIATHASFWQFLCGISIGTKKSPYCSSNSNGKTTAAPGVSQVVEDPSCCRPLSLLNQDMETSTAMKMLIAAYVGVIPWGAKLQMLRDALSNLEKFGF
jgi:hypothetical protein